MLDPRYVGESMLNEYRYKIKEEIYVHHLSDCEPLSVENQEQMYKKYSSFRIFAIKQGLCS